MRRDEDRYYDPVPSGRGVSLLLKALKQAETAHAEKTAAPALTVRERDVMRFLSEGKTDWEIGQILGIGDATARFHVDNARRKLGGSNRAHAVSRYIAFNGFA